MINVQRLPTPAAITGSNDMSAPTKPAYSVASHVITLFNNQMNNHPALLASVQAGDIPPHARQRIVHLLRYAMTEERPSLAAQISQLINSSRPPLTGEILRNEVERHLNQPSALNPQKTYTQLIHDILQTPSQPASPPPPVLSRARRELQNPGPAQDAGNTSTTQFANALVEDGDRQLSINFANHLIRRWVDANRSSGFGEEKIAVPHGSTFGLAWNALADALDAQPFKTFAQAKGIDVSSLVVKTNGDLSGLKNNQTVSFSLKQDPDWAAASSAVLAAANKLGGDISFHDRGHAPAEDVAAFYLVRNSRFNSDDRLFTIDQLLKEQNFSSISNTDSYYAAQFAPVQQRQREAKQQVAKLPTPQLSRLLAAFTPTPATQKVKDADQALAHLCSQALGQAFANTIEKLPEYSTFNLVRNNLKDALNSPAFTTFVRENNLDLSSIRIKSDDGTLKGKVKGVDTTFPVNAISDWASVWQDVEPAVKQMATGSGDYVDYPGANPATLPEVLRFYAEEPLPPNGFPQDGWQQRSRVAHLSRSAQITRDNGFKALVAAPTDDARSRSVRETQQAVALQLSAKTLNLSPLETLAAAVKNRMQDTDTAALPEQGPDTPEDALASTESALAAAVHGVMLELKNAPNQVASKMVESIPANSLIGQWRAYLDKALKGRGFTEWAQKQNIDLTSLRFDPTDNALIGKVNGLEQRFTATDFAQKYPEHFDVLAPVLNAAAVFTAHGKTIALVQPNNSMPFEWVGSFYGISNDYSSPAFAQQTELMGRTQQFPQPPEHPEKVVNWLNRQRTVLGNSNDRYALIDQLKIGIINRDDTEDARRFVVDEDSSHQPKGLKTATAFLAENGWNIPQWEAESDNLLLALRTPLPQSPALGNHWGFLSTDLPLSAEQRSAVTAHVKASIGDFATLISYLSAHVDNISTDPKEALVQLLASDKAIELATGLQTKMKGASTPTSLKQWLLTALVLELDPTAGTQHKTVAGVDLMGIDNSGRSTLSIHDRFNLYLATQKNIPGDLAPIASHLLLSGAAPQLLVKDVPKELTLGSPAWFNFTAAVNQIEWAAPGATTNMTYQQVMDHYKIQPISTLETQIQSYAQMNPLLDWAALNNNVDKNNYTLEQLRDSQQKLQSQVANTAEAIRWLSTNQAPNRRDMALKVLKEKFGPTIDYEKRFMLENEFAGIISGRHYSLVEIYEAGRLDESWMQEGNHVDFASLRSKATEPGFPVINDEFNKAIKEDFNLRRRHTATLFKDMIRKMPVEERKSLIYGAVEFLNVDGGTSGSGMVITSNYNGVRRDFAAYPSRGQIVRIADIDPSTPLGKTVSLEIDAAAFKNGTEPKPGTQSDVVLRTTDQHLLDDNNEPWPLEVSFPAHKENDAFSPGYVDGRISKLASVMIDSTYLNKTEFVNLHRNWSSNTLETATQPSDFFKALWHSLPGASSLEDLYHGQFLKAGVDLAIDVAITLATEGAGKLWGLTKSAASWAAGKVAAGFIEKFGAKEAENIALRDITATNASKSFNSINRLQGIHLGEQAGQLVIPEATVADRTVIRPGEGQRVKLTTIAKDGERYAYNAKTMQAEGAALEWVLPEGSDRIGRIRLGGAIETLTPIDGAVQTYVDTYKGNPRLNIFGHAPEPDVLGTPIQVAGENGTRYSAAEINQKLLERGVDIRQFENVRTIICFSASGGEHSFAAELNAITGVPVKGFEGPVISATTGSVDIRQQYNAIRNNFRTKFPRESEENIEYLSNIQLNNFFRTNSAEIHLEKNVGEMIEVNIGTQTAPVYLTVPIDYRPIKFAASSKGVTP
ncbi:hypothetical protein F3K53_00285 [Pseudomonas veronii]|uniref:Uncharacterized protein n=1 Tax=Pseudomonas veronii TaxID=76761 RepID=A0A5M8G126_PSEVE|nr:hypothetical protein [Pseudomonas veronii]KAA6189663.1 hypothetical protein F3K53_00285 [Pseudomonas veronii]